MLPLIQIPQHSIAILQVCVCACEWEWVACVWLNNSLAVWKLLLNIQVFSWEGLSITLCEWVHGILLSLFADTNAAPLPPPPPVFSLAYLRHVGPTSLQYRIPFDVATNSTYTMPSCHALILLGENTAPSLRPPTPSVHFPTHENDKLNHG